MTNKIIWRLKEQPSSESLRSLVKDGLLTKEEAREILFSSQTEEERDKKSLESEIKFLRELVEKLSNRNSYRIVEVIKEVQEPYYAYGWIKPYEVWCNSTTDSNSITFTGGDTTNAIYTATGTITASTTSNNFSDIKTF